MLSPLQALGKTAIDLLDPDESLQDPEQSFSHHWRSCGGQQSFDEVERLSNDSARLCNLLTAKMPPAERQAFEQTLTEIAPLLDAGQSPASQVGSITSTGTAEEACCNSILCCKHTVSGSAACYPVSSESAHIPSQRWSVQWDAGLGTLYTSKTCYGESRQLENAV